LSRPASVTISGRLIPNLGRRAGSSDMASGPNKVGVGN